MLHRLAIEESDAETASSQASIASGVSSIDINDSRTPSMSTIFNNSSSSQPTSPVGSVSSGMSKPSFPFHLRKNSSSSSDSEKKKKEDTLVRWLRDGTVIYKSVGLGLMDLVVGMHLVKVANEKNVGTSVEGF